MPQKVLLLAGDTDGNLGDLAIATAICHTLRETGRDIEISLMSSRPDRDREQLAVKTIPRGFRGLGKLARAARSADLVICGGGGLFQDDDSLLKMPYWALRLAAVRLVAKRIAGLSIGAGPLDHRMSRLFARLALKTLQPVSARDAPACAVLGALTEKPVHLVPDPAFLLKPADTHSARHALTEAGVPLDGKPLVGVAVRRLFHKRANLVPYQYTARLGFGRNRGRSQMAALVASLASLLNELVARTNAHIVFMPTYDAEFENDREVCEAVATGMRADTFSIIQTDDPGLYKAITSQLAVMFCGRMHPAILAAGCGTPVVGLAYNPKFEGMFCMLGQRERCLSATELAQHGETGEALALLVDSIESPSGRKPETSRIAESTHGFIRGLLPEA